MPDLERSPRAVDHGGDDQLIANDARDPETVIGEGPIPPVSIGSSDARGPTASEQGFGSPESQAADEIRAAAGVERMSRDDLDADRIQPGLDDATVRQRVGELKGVLGIDVNFQQLLEQEAAGGMRDTVDRELPNLARLGARILRVNVPVDQPDRYEGFKQVLEGVAAYNQRHPEAPIKVDLLANPAVTDFSLDGAAGQGEACAAQVRRFIAYCGAPLVAQTVAAVELFNEPEAEWKDEAVGLDAAGAAQRDSTVMNAGMSGLEGQLPDGVAVTPGAHEWDPACEEPVLSHVAAEFDSAGGDPAVLQATAATAIEHSGFATRLARFALDYRARVFADRDLEEVVEIPIALHIYNNPLVSRGLMDAVASIAARAGINCVFNVRVTELQIDAVAHDHPSPRQVAEGIVDLGVHVMDAAAQHPDRLTITQMVAFSYHHRLDAEQSGTDFGLKDNRFLPEVLGP